MQSVLAAYVESCRREGVEPYEGFLAELYSGTIDCDLDDVPLPAIRLFARALFKLGEKASSSSAPGRSHWTERLSRRSAAGRPVNTPPRSAARKKSAGRTESHRAGRAAAVADQLVCLRLRCGGARAGGEPRRRRTAPAILLPAHASTRRVLLQGLCCAVRGNASSLRYVELSGLVLDGVSASAAPLLDALSRCTALRTLRLARTAPLPRDLLATLHVVTLEEAGRGVWEGRPRTFPQLTELDLRGCGLTDDCTRGLEGLLSRARECASLARWRQSLRGPTTAAAAAVTTTCTGTALRCLDVSDNALGDRALLGVAAALVDAEGAAALTALNFSGNAVTVDGLRCFVESGVMSAAAGGSLAMLDVSRNPCCGEAGRTGRQSVAAVAWRQYGLECISDGLAQLIVVRAPALKKTATATAAPTTPSPAQRPLSASPVVADARRLHRAVPAGAATAADAALDAPPPRMGPLPSRQLRQASSPMLMNTAQARQTSASGTGRRMAPPPNVTVAHLYGSRSELDAEDGEEDGEDATCGGRPDDAVLGSKDGLSAITAPKIPRGESPLDVEWRCEDSTALDGTRAQPRHTPSPLLPPPLPAQPQAPQPLLPSYAAPPIGATAMTAMMPLAWGCCCCYCGHCHRCQGSSHCGCGHSKHGGGHAHGHPSAQRRHHRSHAYRGRSRRVDSSSSDSRRSSSSSSVLSNSRSVYEDDARGAAAGVSADDLHHHRHRHRRRSPHRRSSSTSSSPGSHPPPAPAAVEPNLTTLVSALTSPSASHPPHARSAPETATAAEVSAPAPSVGGPSAAGTPPTATPFDPVLAGDDGAPPAVDELATAAACPADDGGRGELQQTLTLHLQHQQSLLERTVHLFDNYEAEMTERLETYFQRSTSRLDATRKDLVTRLEKLLNEQQQQRQQQQQLVTTATPGPSPRPEESDEQPEKTLERDLVELMQNVMAQINSQVARASAEDHKDERSGNYHNNGGALSGTPLAATAPAARSASPDPTAARRELIASTNAQLRNLGW